MGGAEKDEPVTLRDRLQSRIASAAAELERLGKSPEQAVEMLRLLVAAAEGDLDFHAKDVPKQVPTTAQQISLGCLCPVS
jgi:hypothetical protein